MEEGRACVLKVRWTGHSFAERAFDPELRWMPGVVGGAKQSSVETAGVGWGIHA